MDKSIKILTETNDEIELSFFDDTEISSNTYCKGLSIKISDGQGTHEVNITQSEINEFTKLMKKVCNDKF
jgi:hypothetical protein